MTVLMFWNLGRNAPCSLVVEACKDHKVDVLILAESGLKGSTLTNELNTNGEYRFFQQPTAEGTISFFLRLPKSTINPAFDNGRITIQAIELPVGANLIVAACHLPSKMYSDERDQAHHLRRLRREIERVEERLGHQNTVVIGDLNVNPYELALTAADGLHGVMDKRIAQKPPRTIQGEQWDYFYNPMWSRLGDESPGPPGTYYRSGGGISNPYWHMLDQLLLRPSLLPFYRKENLKVLAEVAGRSLLSEIGPDKSISDHLPLVIELELERGTK